MALSVDNLGELEKILLSIAATKVNDPAEAIEDIENIKKEAVKGLKMMGYDNETMDMLGLSKYGEA